MVDSRAKGQRAEYQVRNLLKEQTKLPWERVPGSGGFGPQHHLKGDIYIPNKDIVHCIEVKHYKEDTLNSNIFNDSESQLEKFWKQTLREATQIQKEPLLVFKKDRGKWIVVYRYSNETTPKKHIRIKKGGMNVICELFEDWLKDKTPEYFLR